MRFLAVLLTFAFVSTAIVTLAPAASATCDLLEPGTVQCVRDFLAGECIVNPVSYVTHRPPYYMCLA